MVPFPTDMKALKPSPQPPTSNMLRISTTMGKRKGIKGFFSFHTPCKDS